MIWKDHSKEVLEGNHAFLSPSKYHWINYSDSKLRSVFKKHMATVQGVYMHDFAKRCIILKQRLPEIKKTLNMYVNDAIDLSMRPEEKLYFSPNCYGTADTISFNNNYLRIHDLKTGDTKASLHQLEIYAAIFCLDYGLDPFDLSGIELRIYQNDDILIGLPQPCDIKPVIDTIIHFDELIEKCKEDGYEL